MDADTEILELAAQSMKALFGLDFSIEIGHGKLFTALADLYGIDGGTAETIRKLIEAKNFASIESMNIPKPFKMLPKMFGNATDEDLSVLDSFVEETGSEKIKEIIEYIKSIIIKLKEKGYGNCLSFDLGLVGRLDYYTGIIFGGFVKGVGHSVLLGGRYDNLTANFGRALASTGFSITVDDIFDLLKDRKNGKAPEETLRPISIALTKGRLEKKTIELFEKNGIDCSSLINKGRKLVFPLDNGRFEVMLVKSRDVITYVERGVCDLGIVGSDTIAEYGSSVYELADLGFGKCRMALAGNAKYKNDPEAFFGGYSKKVIATKFVNITKRYAAARKADVETVSIEGSVELAPILGLADGIVDIVETGDTLRENGLEIIEELFPISARIVANIAATKLRKKEIDCILSDVMKV
jgi:ATP phosphoribosyltransferase regulatory subunit